MKNFFPPFAKLVAVAACALTLGSCNRAEYAMLPQGASYHGVTRVAAPVPAAATAPVAAATPAPVAEPVVAAPAPAAAPELAPAASVAHATPAAQPAAKTAQPAASVATSALGTAATVATPAPKLNGVQRLALNKVTRKMNKLMQSSTTVRQYDNTASTSETAAISGNLRTGLILLLVGLLVGIFNGLIGSIIALIGVIFIVLWLLDAL